MQRRRRPRKYRTCVKCHQFTAAIHYCKAVLTDGQPTKILGRTGEPAKRLI